MKGPNETGGKLFGSNHFVKSGQMLSILFLFRLATTIIARALYHSVPKASAD
jgi:hypothetical protein